MKSLIPRSFISLFTISVLSSALPAFAADNYKIVARYKAGAETWSYDYLRVDAPGRRIFVAHEKCVEVINADTGEKIGRLEPMTRAHGIALDPATGHGFASSGVNDQVTMFDLKTLATIKQFKSTGSNPDSIEYDPESKHVYTGNHGGGGVTVIDPATGDIVGTIPIEGKLEGIAFDGRGQGFVNVEDKSAVAVFDTHTLKPKGLWSAAPGEGGTGLAADPTNHRLFSACANNKVVVLDSDSGKVITTVASGEDPDGLAFDPKTNRIFTSNPDGTMSVIQQDSADKYTPMETAKTEPGCKTITLDAKTGNVVTCAPKFGPVPAPVKGGPRPRAPILPGTFEVVIVGIK